MANKVLTIILAAILLACAFFITDRIEQNIIVPEEQGTVTEGNAAVISWQQSCFIW